jgi:hypothetical protein
MKTVGLHNSATGVWPIKYPGVPVTSSKLHVIDWLPVDEKLILINSSLSSIPTYYMSMYLLPKTILKNG